MKEFLDLSDYPENPQVIGDRAERMTKYDVYEDTKHNHLYSEGVTRTLGENKSITNKGDVFLASVQPLMCDPDECGLVKIGTLEA